MAFDNTKYHCEINSVPYNIKGYQKTELATFVPRLSSGDQKESDFDLLKNYTFPDFSGGALQREQLDPNMVYAIEGMITRYNDDLYVTNEIVTETDKLNATYAVQIKGILSTPYGLVVTGRILSSPVTGGIWVIQSDHTVKTVDVSALGTSTAYFRAIGYDDVNGYVLVWSSTVAESFGYIADITGTPVWTEITSGTNMAVGECVFYRGANYVTNIENSKLYRFTGTYLTESYEELGTYGRQNVSATESKMLVYNNRIILTRPEGLYAYDGVQITLIEDRSDFPNYGIANHKRNYAFPTVMAGYLYYWHTDGMYRFNGSLIEKLYDSKETGNPFAMSYGNGKLWITFSSNATHGSSRYDKSLGFDFTSPSTSISNSLFCFDGKGIYCYRRTPTATDLPYPRNVVWYEGRVYMLETPTSGKTHYVIDDVPAAGTYPFTLVTGIFDGEFPQIDKSIENLELAFDGTITARTLTLEYRTSGFDTSSWTSFGTINTDTEKKRFIWKTIPAGLTFRKIQFRITGSIDPTYGIEKIMLRYLLMPDYKNQWTFTTLNYGDNALSPLQLVDNTEGAQAVSLLRNNLYSARNSKVPIKFIDVDQLDLNEALDDTETAVTLNSTALLKGSDGFIQIDDEIMYWYARTATDLTVLRGQLSTSAAAHSDNSKVFIVYRAIIRNIQNERIELVKSEEDTTEDKNRASEVTLTLQEV